MSRDKDSISNWMSICHKNEIFCWVILTDGVYKIGYSKDGVKNYFKKETKDKDKANDWLVKAYKYFAVNTPTYKNQ